MGVILLLTQMLLLLQVVVGELIILLLRVLGEQQPTQPVQLNMLEEMVLLVPAAIQVAAAVVLALQEPEAMLQVKLQEAEKH